jgi:hypothetical protein
MHYQLQSKVTNILQSYDSRNQVNDPTRPSNFSACPLWTAQRIASAKKSSNLFFIKHVIPSYMFRTQLRDRLVIGIRDIELIDIECVLLSFLSKNFVSTKWRIYKGISSKLSPHPRKIEVSGQIVSVSWALQKDGGEGGEINWKERNM